MGLPGLAELAAGPGRIQFGFCRDERAALISAEPTRFLLHRLSDQRYNWIDARMALLNLAEMREFVTDAWRMVVPKSLAAAHLGPLPTAPAQTRRNFRP